MQAPHSRNLTPARFVALTLLALLALLLAYIRFAPGSETVSVPEGARAGDLALTRCTYDTGTGSYAADCGTLVVPESRTNPQSRLIAVPMTRIRARSNHPAEPIFRLEGGPGKTNMNFSEAGRFLDEHDVVLVGYRGVDGSVRLDCPEVESAIAHSNDSLTDESYKAVLDGYRACATRLANNGVDLAGYGLAQQVDDMEAARLALGYGSIDLISESAGTRTAMIYSWRYPNSIHRSVMIGVNPPGNFVWNAKTTDEQIARYSALCAKDASCSERTEDLAATMTRTNTRIPDRWFFLPIKKGNLRVISFWGMMETTPAAGPATAPMMLDSWLAAADGDASGFWFGSLAADLLFPKAFVWGQYAAAARPDAQAARDYFSSGAHDPGANLGSAAAAFAWGAGGLADAWPAAPDESQYSHVQMSNVETLLIGGELDFTTPPQVATTELLPYLPNGHQVVLPGFGHSMSFWSDQPEAGSQLIRTFLDSGRVDDSLYKPATIDFTPTMSQGAIAKIVLGSMLALAALALVLLLWMAYRVHVRGHFGNKTGAVLRALLPAILGLGGWLLVSLVVMTTMRDVPLNDELLVSFSTGVPIGLCIYLAWVNRDWSARTRFTGLAAATGAGAVGAWLGFNATEDILAILTAILGATVGANLVLIVLDISWDRQGRDRFGEVDAEGALEAPF